MTKCKKCGSPDVEFLGEEIRFKESNFVWIIFEGEARNLEDVDSILQDLKHLPWGFENHEIKPDKDRMWFTFSVRIEDPKRAVEFIKEFCEAHPQVNGATTERSYSIGPEWIVEKCKACGDTHKTKVGGAEDWKEL